MYWAQRPNAIVQLNTQLNTQYKYAIEHVQSNMFDCTCLIAHIAP